MNYTERPIYQLDSIQLELIIEKILDKKFKEYIEHSYRPEVIHTRDEAARILSVRPNTISNYINSGILVNKGIGRKILISSIDLDRLLNKPFFNKAA